MGAVKIRKWSVEDCCFDDMEIRANVDDGEGRRVEVEQGGDTLWIDPDDVPALIEALQAARTALTT